MPSAPTTFTDAAVSEPRDGGLRSRRGDPPWELAESYPRQGEWSEEDYLALDTHRLIEFSDGELEFLPMPDLGHQLLIGTIFELLSAFVRTHQLGRVVVAGYRVRIRPGKFREPDVLFLANGRSHNRKFAAGADLVVEIVSPGAENRERDFAAKRVDYAAASVPEYWIVDPEQQTITVLTLQDGEYRTHGTFAAGDQATSALLDGFTVDVTECFAAAK